MRTCRLWFLAIFGYVAASVALSWPLLWHLSTALPGPIGGDTGVYVWNLWLFRHEILVHHRLPYFTSEILSLTPPVDLSLHNYTVFDDLLAFPLIALWGPVVAYNVVYLVVTVLSASTMFALAKHYCRSAGAAWVGGLLFAWSPTLVARSEGHLSLVTAAALPAFVLAFVRWWRSGRFADAVLAGLMLAWAVTSDPYYGVYCLMIGGAFVGASCLRLSRAEVRPNPPARLRGTVDAALALVGALVGAIVWTGGFDMNILGLRAKAYTLYTPVLLLTVLGGLRLLLAIRPRLTFIKGVPLTRAARGVTGVTIGCALPLIPFFVALAARVADAGRFQNPTLWRSSPPGVDLLAFVVPNPNSALIGGWLRAWTTAQPGGFVENVASLTFVGVAVIAVAMWRSRFRPPLFWLVATGGFALLSLGPFVHIAGTNTFIPAPWALLRYVPVVASARMPARFAIPMMMGLAILFAGGLSHISRLYPARRPAVIGFVAVALLLELTPAPRLLYDASVPDIYATVARDPRLIRIMELPLGFRDGESSYGDFSAASQFYQTFHQKPLIGGYLSRISKREIQRQLGFPIVRELVALSEGRALAAAERADLFASAARFAARARLAYVVMDRGRTPESLRRTAIDAFGLTKIGEDDGHELYLVPAVTTAVALASNQDLAFPMPPIAPIDK